MRLRSLRGFAAGLPATFWWLWGGGLVSSLATFVFPFLALFLTARGLGLAQAGAIVGLLGLGSIVSTPLAGFLTDRFGRRPAMLWSLISTAALTALLAALSSPLPIAITVLALGATMTAYRPPAMAAITDVVPAEDRTRAFGLFYWAMNLGVGVSLLVGGVLARHGYGRLFLADAATTLLCAGVVWARVPETRPELPAPPPGKAPGYRTVIADRVFLAFLGLYLAWLTVFCQFQATLPLDMTGKVLSAAAFGRVLAVNTALIVALQPSLTRFVQRFPPGRALAAASVLVGAGYGAYALCEREWQYALATVIWSLGEIVTWPVAAAVVSGLSTPELRGRYQGLFAVAFGAGSFVATALGAAALERFGAVHLWTGCLVAGLAIAAGFLALTSPLRRTMTLRAVKPAVAAARD